MSNEQTWNTKVRQASRGCEDSVNWLAREAQGRVRAYVYRVTLDHDLTDDLSQEALFQMIKSIRQLNEEESFWPWLYRIAQSKIQEHYRCKKQQALISEDAFCKDFLSYRGDYYQDEHMRDLLQEDLLKKVIIAMKQLKQQYRAVLSLRCLDQLSYAEIADTFECNEVTVRVLFYRAKKALRKQLASQGLGKNMMLMSLGLFGRLTLIPNECSSSTTGAVSEASIKVGPTATVLGTVCSKTGVLLLPAAVLLLAIFGLDLFPERASDNPVISLPARDEISSLHFTMQFQNNNPGAGSLSRGAYEQWYYFPEGIEGPMYMRMQRWDPNTGEKLCTWLNNEHGNYYYESGERILYLWNRRIRWASLKVRRLPSDSAEFANFISKVEGELPVDTTYNRDEKTGMLTSSVDHRLMLNAPDYLTEYEYNTLDTEPFKKYFPYALSEIDQRDQMHKRGWTYFRVEGELDDKEITGTGRIPFIYDTCKEYPAWLLINVGDEFEIVDCNSGAYLRSMDGNIISTYSAGTFFKGLSRPWTGLHTMDAVRRDAGEQQVWFYTELTEDKEDVIITLFKKEIKDSTDMIYVIDVEHDLIEEILFTVDTEITGSLEFTYLQDIDRAESEFSEPVIRDSSQSSTQENPGILWLINLAEGIGINGMKEQESDIR